MGIPYVEMEELLAQADFISVHAPAVDGGALINAESIAKMKDGVVIINTSRGTNVDEAALLEALESGKVRAAGLDVWAEEQMCIRDRCGAGPARPALPGPGCGFRPLHRPARSPAARRKARAPRPESAAGGRWRRGFPGGPPRRGNPRGDQWAGEPGDCPGPGWLCSTPLPGCHWAAPAPQGLSLIHI